MNDNDGICQLLAGPVGLAPEWVRKADFQLIAGISRLIANTYKPTSDSLDQNRHVATAG